mmetsp:Transcript_1629/g.5434  ORF Transcript_1629/g.5434 Transcript_1629/m.5434 type:complete len:399 (+) Transcript_1629:345-1541(+)
MRFQDEYGCLSLFKAKMGVKQSIKLVLGHQPLHVEPAAVEGGLGGCGRPRVAKLEVHEALAGGIEMREYDRAELGALVAEVVLDLTLPIDGLVRGRGRGTLLVWVKRVLEQEARGGDRRRRSQHALGELHFFVKPIVHRLPRQLLEVQVEVGHLGHFDARVGGKLVHQIDPRLGRQAHATTIFRVRIETLNVPRVPVTVVVRGGHRRSVRSLGRVDLKLHDDPRNVNLSLERFHSRQRIFGIDELHGTGQVAALGLGPVHRNAKHGPKRLKDWLEEVLIQRRMDIPEDDASPRYRHIHRLSSLLRGLLRMPRHILFCLARLDHDALPQQLLPGHRHRLHGRLFFLKFHVGKSLGASRLPVADDFDICHRASRAEKLKELPLLRLVVNVEHLHGARGPI